MWRVNSLPVLPQQQLLLRHILVGGGVILHSLREDDGK